MNINLDVLGLTMLDQIGRHVDRGHIVTVDKCSRAERSMELLKKLAKPAALSDCMSHNTILSLGTRVRNCGLALGRPRYQVVTIVDAIPGGGATRVWTASPISIIIGCQSSRGRGPEMKTKI
jgi:hypothetical protein